MVLGGLGTLATLVGVVAVIVVHLQQTASRATCKDNLRRIGVANDQYADDHKTFPAGVAGPAGLPPASRLSWMAEVVPLLGRVGDKADSKRQKERSEPALRRGGRADRHGQGVGRSREPAAVETPVRIFRCPASAGFDPNRGPGLTNYVGLSGIGPDAAALGDDDHRAGMFGDDRGAKPKELLGGTAYTIAVLETAQDRGRGWPGGSRRCANWRRRRSDTGARVCRSADCTRGT